MQPYGLLDWEVIDREEEIYESDDVKDEYKVMLALWSRWIMLNRCVCGIFCLVVCLLTVLLVG